MDGRDERDVFGEPCCWSCRGPLGEVAYWTAMPYPSGRPGLAYWSLCRGCADPVLLELPQDGCMICGRAVVHGPPPDRRGLWRAWTTVCSFDCLGEARAHHQAEPEPRSCLWCGTTFTPARRSDARYCGATCRQRKRRALPITDSDLESPAVRAILDAAGVQPGQALAPKFGDILAAAVDSLLAEPGPE